MRESEYLDYIKTELNDDRDGFTAKEIVGQPQLWLEIFDTISQEKEAISNFISPLLALKDLRIILTGAGSSAFIGEAIQGIVQKGTKRLTQAIATTDIVTHPSSFFLKGKPTLLVSFARSGNSPESLEAVKLANAYCEQIFHLVITCNANGKLATDTASKNYFKLILSETANDKGLAMTGSFTSMLLAMILIVKLNQIERLREMFTSITSSAQKLIMNYLPCIREVAKTAYERVVFLGSGPLLGIAHECHLKLQELTDGQVICKYDSFLGFRHGPRSVVNEKTLLVYLFSNDDHVFQYEKDFARSIALDSFSQPTITFGRTIADIKDPVLAIEFSESEIINNEFYFVLAALLGQLLGYYKSIELGLNPDNPSIRGVINREVQGVTIYPITSIIE